jgi:hypothetical protein
MRFEQQIPGVVLRQCTPYEFEGRAMPPEIQTDILRAYAVLRYGDPELARYLPAGGMYSLKLIPAGIVHDLIAVPIMLLCVGRFAQRRTVRRFLSRKQWRDRVLLCPSCKYNRAGLLDRPCPECGWGGSAAES